MTDYGIFEKTNTSNLQDAFDLKDTLTVEKDKVVLGNKETQVWQELTKRSNFDNSLNNSKRFIANIEEYQAELGIFPIPSAEVIHEEYLPYLKSCFIRSSTPLVDRFKLKQFTPLLESISYRLFYEHYLSCLKWMIERASGGGGLLDDYDKFNRLLTSIEMNMNSNASDKNTEPRNSLGELYVLAVDYVAYLFIIQTVPNYRNSRFKRNVARALDEYHFVVTGNRLEIKDFGLDIFISRAEAIEEQIRDTYADMSADLQALYHRLLVTGLFGPVPNKVAIDTTIKLIVEELFYNQHTGFDLAYTFGISSIIRSSINKSFNNNVKFKYDIVLSDEIRALLSPELLDMDVTVNSMALPFAALVSVDSSDTAVVSKLKQNLGKHNNFKTPLKTFNIYNRTFNREMLIGGAAAELGENPEYKDFLDKCTVGPEKENLVVYEPYKLGPLGKLIGVTYLRKEAEKLPIFIQSISQIEALHKYGFNKALDIMSSKAPTLRLSDAIDDLFSMQEGERATSVIINKKNISRLNPVIKTAVMYCNSLTTKMEHLPLPLANCLDLIKMLLAICIHLDNTFLKYDYQTVMTSTVGELRESLGLKADEANKLSIEVVVYNQLINLVHELINRIPMICRTPILRVETITEFQDFEVSGDIFQLALGQGNKFDEEDLYQQLHPDIDYEYMITPGTVQIDKTKLAGIVARFATNNHGTRLSLSNSTVDESFIRKQVVGITTTAQKPNPLQATTAATTVERHSTGIHPEMGEQHRQEVRTEKKTGPPPLVVKGGPPKGGPAKGGSERGTSERTTEKRTTTVNSGSERTTDRTT